MQSNTSDPHKLTVYRVWDLTTRWFHWINALCVIGLAILGLAILNEKSFGVSADGKVLLKTLHVYLGYAFATNLAWRLIWTFVGSPQARWSAILPFRSGYFSDLRQYVRGFLQGRGAGYLGHNPLSRLMITLLFLLLFTQAVTGLVLAGTDLYKPPFGGVIADWVTGGDPIKLANLKPGSKDFVDATAYSEMRSFRSPVVTVHFYSFSLLMGALLLHIAGVVVTEIREKNGLITAMFTGDKVFSKTPVDVQTKSEKKRNES